MAWTVALGLGMWAAAAFQDSPVPLPVLVWGVLGMLHVLVPLDEWRRVAPFVLLGWCVGHWNLATMRSEMFPNDTNSPTLVQLDCRPTFTPSLGKANQHGVFCCRNEFGHMERMWLGVPDTALRGAGPMWIRVTSPRRFDLSDAFDFPAHLSSLGVTRVGQFLGSTNVESRPSTPATLATAGELGSSGLSAQMNQASCWACLLATGNRFPRSPTCPASVGAVSFAGGQWVPRLPGVVAVFPADAKATTLVALGECVRGAHGLGLCGGHRLVSLGHQGCDDGHLGMVVLGSREILEHLGAFGCRWVRRGRAGPHVAPPVGGAIVVCRDCSPHGVARKAPRLAGASSRPMGHLALERSRLPNLSLPLLPRQCGVSRGGVGLGVLRSGSCVWPGMVQAWAR